MDAETYELLLSCQRERFQLGIRTEPVRRCAGPDGPAQRVVIRRGSPSIHREKRRSALFIDAQKPGMLGWLSGSIGLFS